MGKHRMTDDELQAIRERAEKATPGPWWTEEGSIYASRENLFIGIPHGPLTTSLQVPVNRTEQDLADLAFVAKAREDIPALLAEVERLRAKLAK